MNKLQVLIVLLCLCLLSGCGSNSGSGSKAPVLQAIQVSPAAPSIAAGLTQQFTATATYSDGSTKNVTNSANWTSSDALIATISSSGMATSKTAGSTTITATYSGVSGTATLAVTAPLLVSIAVSPTTASIPLGTSLQFAAKGTFTDGSTQDLTNSASWSSSNTAAASISSTGMAISSATGSTTITATYSGVGGSASLTVAPAALVSIAVSPSSASIAAGTTTQFSATGTYTDDSTQNITASVSWTVGNPAVASINVNGVAGLAKGLAPGASSINASSGNISSSAALTVTNATLVSIAVSPVNASIPLGTLQQFTAIGTFSDGTTQDITDTVTWSSSKNSTVSITVSGLATARSLGTVTITAAFGSISQSTSLNVNAANLSSLAIPQGNSTIAEGTSMAFSAIGTFNDGSTRDLTTQATWTSSNPGVATVAANWGMAQGLMPGTTTITATVGTVSASVTLTVTNATIVSISVTPSGRTIAPDTTLSFTATGTFSDGSMQNISRNANWSSDNTAVATVASGGLATGVAPGTANISAAFNGVSGSAQLNVGDVTLVSIAVTPTTAVLAPASTLGYTAIGTYSDESTENINTVATWTSSNPNVASINSFGQATGQSPGTVTITAELDSVSSPAAQLVVESSPLTSVQITPSGATVAQQTATQFNAIGTFGDGSTQNLSNSATWTASPVSVATVTDGANGGLASGVAPGTATITALFAGQVGVASLTVTNATLTSITVTPSNASIALGTNQSFTATGNFSDGTTEDLTTQVAWASSNINVATITASGLAKSGGTGTTTISASMNGVTGTATLTVYQ